MQQGEHVTRREGRLRHEFLLERGLLRCGGANGTLCWLFRAPRGLGRGRTAGHCFASGCEFQNTPRRRGHLGPCINLYIFDGALDTAQTRYFVGKHELFYSDEYGCCTWENKQELRDTEFTIGLKCRLHGASKGMDWGSRRVQGFEVLDDTFIAISSLQKTSALFLTRTERFIMKFVEFEPRVGRNRDEIREWWLMLEVPLHLIETFVDADPWWDEDAQQLLVCSTFRDDVALWPKLSTIVFACRRWSKWSLTRWGRAGRCTRFLLRSLVTGVSGAVGQILDDETAADTNLAGFAKLSDEVRMFVAVMAVGMKAVEGLILSLLCDDRLFLRSAELLGAMHTKMQETATLPDLIWMRLAAILHKPAAEVRSCILYSMLISYGFVWREDFEELLHMPLLLTQGDIERNVDALAAADEPVAGTLGQRFQKMAKMGNGTCASPP